MIDLYLNVVVTKKGMKEIITLDFKAFVGDHEEYDSIKIEDIPNIHQKIIGEGFMVI